MLTNTPTHYGLVARAFHWLMALFIIALLVQGFWMTNLTYDHPWYNKALVIHDAFGVLAFLLFILRLVWRFYDPAPSYEEELASWERWIAGTVHVLLYLLMGAIPITGYLITTATGSPVSIFGWFELPALLGPQPGMEDMAGKIHLYLGLGMIFLVSMHVVATLKHHFIDRNHALHRMIEFFH
ncbi:MAG: cytochrome b [Magnetococcales bacterium]|nr:cytochrome b [Magnetococcales bacterium]